MEAPAKDESEPVPESTQDDNPATTTTPLSESTPDTLVADLPTLLTHSDPPRSVSEPMEASVPIAETDASTGSLTGAITSSQSAPSSVKAVDESPESFDTGGYGFFGAPTAGEAIEEGADSPPEEDALPEETFDLGEAVGEDADETPENSAEILMEGGDSDGATPKSAPTESTNNTNEASSAELHRGPPGFDTASTVTDPMPTPGVSISDAAMSMGFGSGSFTNDPLVGKPTTLFNQMRTGRSLEEGDLQSFRASSGGGLGLQSGSGSAPTGSLSIGHLGGDRGVNSMFGGGVGIGLSVGGSRGSNVSMMGGEGMFGQQLQQQAQLQLQQQQSGLKGLGLGPSGGYSLLGRPPSAPQALLQRPGSALASTASMQQQQQQALGLNTLGSRQSNGLDPDRFRQQQGLGLNLGQRPSSGGNTQMGGGNYPAGFNSGYGVPEQQGTASTLGMTQRGGGAYGGPQQVVGGSGSWLSGTGVSMGARQQHARSSLEVTSAYGGQGAGAQGLGSQGVGGMQQRGVYDSQGLGQAGGGYMSQQQGASGRQQGSGQGFGGGSAQQMSFRGFESAQNSALGGNQGMAQGLNQGQNPGLGQGYGAPTRQSLAAEQALRRFASPNSSAYGASQVELRPRTCTQKPCIASLLNHTVVTSSRRDLPSLESSQACESFSSL